jgi:site-specific DNA recombinase
VRTPRGSQAAAVANPIRVGAYGRVSTLNQVREKDSSVDTQLARIGQRVAYEADQAQHTNGRPWTVTAEYREEGRSGKNTDRPELQRLLADVRAGRLDVVCVTKIDRITRSLIDFYELWRTFEEHKVEFVSLGDSFETASATGRAMLKLTLVFAELERERTSERTREKIDMRRRAGLWFGGIPPLGYKSNPADKTTLLVDDPAAEVTRRIFQTYLELGSARALTRELAQSGIRRPVHKTTRGKKWGGGHFTTQSLIQILANPVYVAQRDRGDGELIDCKWPALIDRATFDRVQARMLANREKRPSGKPMVAHNFLLEGLLRCGGCGSTMIRTVGTGKSGRAYFYYRCAKKHKTAYQGCSVRDVPAPAVERFVLDQLSSYVIDPAALRASVAEVNAGRDVELTAVESQLQEIDSAYLQKSKQIAKLLDAIETGEGEGDLSLIRRRLRDREAELEDLRARRGEVQDKRDGIRREVLEAETVADAYRRVPHLLAEAQRVGAHDELRGLLQGLVDVVEWRQGADDPKAGEALISLHPLPTLLGRSDEPPSQAVNRPAGCSSSRQDWLRRRVSNPRPGG